MPRPASKTALIETMLRRPKGASLEQLQSATHWQPHSLRAALTRLRKTGHAIERLPASKGGASRYRITDERRERGT